MHEVLSSFCARTGKRCPYHPVHSTMCIGGCEFKSKIYWGNQSEIFDRILYHCTLPFTLACLLMSYVTIQKNADRQECSCVTSRRLQWVRRFWDAVKTVLQFCRHMITLISYDIDGIRPRCMISVLFLRIFMINHSVLSFIETYSRSNKSVALCPTDWDIDKAVPLLHCYSCNSASGTWCIKSAPNLHILPVRTYACDLLPKISTCS